MQPPIVLALLAYFYHAEKFLVTKILGTKIIVTVEPVYIGHCSLLSPKVCTFCVAEGDRFHCMIIKAN